MKLWTWKFVVALVVAAVFVVDATWLPPDPYTGEPRHLLPYTDTGIAPFIFLLSLLYLVSHFGGWALERFRARGRAGRADRRGARSSRPTPDES